MQNESERGKEPQKLNSHTKLEFCGGLQITSFELNLLRSDPTDRPEVMQMLTLQLEEVQAAA